MIFGSPLKRLLAQAAASLSAAGIEQPRREAYWLAANAAGTDQSGLLHGAAIEVALFESLIRRRTAREPLAYILGNAPFRALTLEVSPATLIPRADSETLIEAALVAFPDRGCVRRVLDLGTGTGCLLLAALVEFEQAWGLGVDVALEACGLAQRNAVRNGLAARCGFVCGDWAAAVGASFDLVLANPPYIPTDEIPLLMPEVAAHEPARALDGGADGLECYRLILAGLDPLLAPGGVAISELGAGQAEQVGSLATQAGWATALHHDPAGHARALILHRASD